MAMVFSRIDFVPAKAKKKIKKKDAMARDITHLPYRPCVGVALFNPAGLVFVGKRRTDKVGAAHEGGYAWQMPQGGIDKGEDPYRAALRELAILAANAGATVADLLQCEAGDQEPPRGISLQRTML
jgi:hypothetical protein